MQGGYVMIAHHRPVREFFHQFLRPVARSAHLPGVSQLCRLSVEQLEDRTVPSTFTVQNLNDLGSGSLRQAILDANNTPGADTIKFAPGVTGTINLASALPDLSSNIDLEGPG